MKNIKIFIWSAYIEECKNIIYYITKLLRNEYYIQLTDDSNEADIIFTNHWKPEKVNINLDKKIIYWSGESYPNNIIQNNKPYIELDSFINSNSNTSFHFPYMLACKYWNKNIKQFNNEKTKFLAFCVSNGNAYSNCANRINIFNKFCQAFPDKIIEALGSEYGNYKEKHRKIEGYHATLNTIEEYSKFKFVLAIENNIKEGYVTEKIINAFASGAVPIYQGCSKTVKKQFNKKCYIDINDFKSIEDCIEYVKNISNEEYNKMITTDIYNREQYDILNIIDKNDNYQFEKSEYWINMKNKMNTFIDNI
jgi:hypothetical protein